MNTKIIKNADANQQSLNTERKSPLKWAGGKKRIIHHIKDNLPSDKKKRLIEPFVGGGSVFLNLEFEEYLLVDTNPDLINLFKLIKTKHQSLLNKTQKLFISKNNTPENYYALREHFNNASSKLERASLFIFLNRHGYNGLCRYNAKGGFNVPFGSYKKPYFPEREINQFNVVAQKAEFLCGDFSKAFKLAQVGDVIYCDPPYAPINQTANFTAYAGHKFSEQDQRRIVLEAQKVQERGVATLISNHDLAITREIYQHADSISSIDVQRNISCKGAIRNKVTEVLALYHAR
ncbi:Dam family site-specific DNA-(adenine-N6)-methyltransferase [Glaciecola sp. KUL10]|uniref:Dam family site-specific DNA-(adenine-N6)-methyltransferase n=1 Tax=Glaciecola sp. (strain KUL10) TaxID=2161813 RepID=UPI000D873930|nr:Dam family site-specific DNA-(adenine-N6)-methyltransferase [Glaciecola sp. KUL10]GBL03754.1 DNA adenine methylase [Glaciecola sp. KUL10]